MFTTDDYLQIAVSLFGTLGFGVLFNIRGKKLAIAGVGGMVAWLLYLLLFKLLENEVLCYLIVSLSMAIYSEIAARRLKTPAITFEILSLIPLIPGSALYYSIAYALEGDQQLFIEKAVHTLSLAAALSVGIILVSATMKYINVWKAHQKNKSSAR